MVSRRAAGRTSIAPRTSGHSGFRLTPGHVARRAATRGWRVVRGQPSVDAALALATAHRVITQGAQGRTQLAGVWRRAAVNPHQRVAWPRPW